MFGMEIHNQREYWNDRQVRWLAALIIGLMLAVLCCGLQARTQRKLSEKLLRLHVVAHSDEVADQKLKLLVRDAVLACKVSRVPQVEELRRVEAAAKDCLRAHGCSDPVKVSYMRMYFETRDYPGFSLPAGYYQALRVVIGEGEGQNWWCVIYPALCFDLAEAEGELSEEELALIQKDGKKYLVRFKISEWISGLVHEILE